MEIIEVEGDDEESDGGSSKEIRVYDRSVNVEEIVPLIIKKNRCKKIVPSLQISWTALHTQFISRSVDDLRNFWQLKLLPLLLPASLLNSGQEWTEQDDLDLL